MTSNDELRDAGMRALADRISTPDPSALFAAERTPAAAGSNDGHQGSGGRPGWMPIAAVVAVLGIGGAGAAIGLSGGSGDARDTDDSAAPAVAADNPEIELEPVDSTDESPEQLAAVEQSGADGDAGSTGATAPGSAPDGSVDPDMDTSAADDAQDSFGGDDTGGDAGDADNVSDDDTSSSASDGTTSDDEPSAVGSDDALAAAIAAEGHAAVYRGGQLFLEGAVPSEEVAEEFQSVAEQVIGEGNVINNYTIDPSRPPVTDGVVLVDEPFLFATGSADLDPAYTDLLDLGVVVMNLNPQAEFHVTGHTDDRGDPTENLALSTDRAQAVADYLVANGIAADRIVVDGKGDTEPVADNDTSEGRALNRRIEVRLLRLLGA